MQGFEVYEKKFAPSGSRVFRRAMDEASRSGRNYVTVEHLISALGQEEPDIFAKMFAQTGAEEVVFQAALDERLADGTRHEGKGVRLAPNAILVLKLASTRALRRRRSKIEAADLFVELALDAHGALCEIMASLGVNHATLVRVVFELEAALDVARAFAGGGAQLAGKPVRIRSGPFANFTGYVADVHEAAKKLEVGVSIFGAKRFIELNYQDIEILDFAGPHRDRKSKLAD
jgi:ATP-dependent Clp protease ATP-binding subunit ClpA